MTARVEIFQENVREKTISLKLFKEIAHSLDPFPGFPEGLRHSVLCEEHRHLPDLRHQDLPGTIPGSLWHCARVHLPTGKTK